MKKMYPFNSKIKNTKRKQQVIVIDGPDSCGKTEIGLALSNVLSVPYFKNYLEQAHFKLNPDYFYNATKHDQWYILQFLEQTKYSAIFDRSYPSEYVYAQAFNRKTDFDLLSQIDQRYAKLNAKIIIPYRSDYSNCTDNLIENDKFNRIHELYEDFSKFTKCDVHMLNVDDEDLNRELIEIKKFLNMKERK